MKLFAFSSDNYNMKKRMALPWSNAKYRATHANKNQRRANSNFIAALLKQYIPQLKNLLSEVSEETKTNFLTIFLEFVLFL